MTGFSFTIPFTRRWVAPLLAVSACLLLFPLPPASAQASTPEPPPPLTLSELERSVAQELSTARQNPSGMADDLASATHDGFYAAALPNGVTFSTLENYLSEAEREARNVQPVLGGLRWSETLAEAAREWAPHYQSVRQGRPFSEAHGCPNYCFADRISRARQRADDKLGYAIEAIATQPMYGKSFAYTWWVSSSEWTIGSFWNPNGDYSDGKTVGNRGHRGIVDDSRMTAVGVACVQRRHRPVPNQEPPPPVADCVAILGQDVADEAPNVLGAPTDTSLSQLAGTSGTLGATTGDAGSTLTVDPFAPAPETDEATDGATSGQPVGVDQEGNVTTPNADTDAAPSEPGVPGEIEARLQVVDGTTGGQLSWTLSVANPGGVDAPITRLFVDLPPGVIYVPGSSTGFTAADPLVNGQRISWEQADLAIPAGAELSITFGVDASAVTDNYAITGGAFNLNTVVASTRATADAPSAAEPANIFPKPEWTAEKQYALLDVDNRTFEYALSWGITEENADRFGGEGTWQGYHWYPCPQGVPTVLLESPNVFYERTDTPNTGVGDSFGATTIAAAEAAGFTPTNSACEARYANGN